MIHLFSNSAPLNHTDIMNYLKEDIPEIRRLTYKPGETIIKAGDYGVSIYQVIEGQVKVYMEKGLQETELAILGPGEVFGEMIYVSRNNKPRLASVRALEMSVIEVWHPDMISSEYESMSPVAKIIADEIIDRLSHLNQLLLKLHGMKKKNKKVEKQKTTKKGVEKNYTPKERRKFYRKQVNTSCTYRTLLDPHTTNLIGTLENISQSGLCIKIPKDNTRSYSYKPGDDFIVKGVLPTGRNFETQVRIANVIPSSLNKSLQLGLFFVNHSEEVMKNIGFFLMK